jgi:CMP-N-acetylneuraminic acid synthetase
MKKITAIIPVRKGSQRVKNKNIKKFANSNLLTIKIERLKQVDLVDEIIVSSDCEQMLSIAKSLGVKTHKRDKYYASSEATNSEFFKNLAQSIKCDNILYSPVTCPMISVETFIECINAFNTCENIVTVSPIKHHLWLDGKPINYDIQQAPNSQDLPDIYSITYGVCLIHRNDMITNGNIVTPNPTFFVLDEIESTDIDTEYDFMVAEHVYNKIYLENR